MKFGALSELRYCFLASSIVFIFVPIFMMGNSPQDFDFINISTFLKSSAIFGLLLGAALSFFCGALNYLAFSQSGKLFSAFILIWTLVAGFFLPVSSSTGMVDPENISINTSNFVSVLLLSSATSLLSLTPVWRHVLTFVAVFLLITTIPALFAIFPTAAQVHASDPGLQHESLSISNKKSILVISFDGLPGHIVAELVRQEPNYAEAFKDFTLFTNVISQSPSTLASQIGEIFGTRDYKSMGNSSSEVLEALYSDGSVGRLPINLSPDSYVRGYPDVTHNNVYLSSKAATLIDEHETYDFFRYPIVRIFSRIALKLVSWVEENTALKTIVIAPDSTLEISERLRNHNGPDWDKRYILDLTLYKEFVSQLSVSNKPFSLRYLHFVFTHFPVDLDDDCEYRSDDLDWYRSNQNIHGLKNQTKCALNQFINLIDRLKILGLYDTSLIVLKSDHGEPSSYFTDAPYSLRINGKHRWGYSRYRPTLLLKDYGSNQRVIGYRDNLVLLNDLANTICGRLDYKADCSEFQGVNLLGGKLEADVPYYLYVPKNETSDFRFQSHISVKIASRKVTLLDALRQSDLVSMIELGSETDTTHQQ